MSSAEFQATDISVYEYEPKMPNEKLLWNILRQAETKIKTLQQENPMLTECEIDMIVRDDVIVCKTLRIYDSYHFSTTTILNKIETNLHEDKKSSIIIMYLAHDTSSISKLC